MIGKEFFHANQIVLDVGIHADENGKLCGDVNYAEAEGLVKAITPVPGGVGTVTTSVLVKHIIKAARKKEGLI
jgi:methylenetetrahydrofolate dehydrogenase (NADP+)/methenyltetrahydrofolate cyclohydrolase